jgi:hypothetical protein
LGIARAMKSPMGLKHRGASFGEAIFRLPAYSVFASRNQAFPQREFDGLFPDSRKQIRSRISVSKPPK